VWNQINLDRADTVAKVMPPQMGAQMKRLAVSFLVLSFCVASAFAQAPAKPQGAAPENVPVGAAKFATKADKAAAKKKKADCQKQAKDQKLASKASRAFVNDCVAK
jgi:hypothetical protein